MVKDEEARIDAVRDAIERDIDRVRMAAEIPARFEQRDFMAVTRELPCGGKSRNARAYDCDLHAISRL